MSRKKALLFGQCLDRVLSERDPSGLINIYIYICTSPRKRKIVKIDCDIHY